MSLTGRNDPCPCGSGLKFKRCCLNKNEVTKSYLQFERDSGLAKLMCFSDRAEFEEAHAIAIQLFWGDWLLQKGNEDLKRVMEGEQVNLAYDSWFAYDLDRGDGRTLLDLFLGREVNKLTSGERNFLEGMRGSHLRPYEILDVKTDQGFELRDLWDDQRLYVRERAATRYLVQWELIVARIAPSGDGEVVFENLPYVFPATDKDDLLKGVRKAHRVFTEEFGNQSTAKFFKEIAPVFHQLWLERVALPPRPKIITADGEPFIFAKVLFDLLDREAAICSFAEREDIVDHGDGSYGWLEPGNEFDRSLGIIVLEDRRVVLETTSQRRAERGRDFLQSLLGKAVNFKAISYEDVGQAMKRAPKSESKEPLQIPPEVEAEIMGRYFADYYRKWLEEPVPALGGRTPRHAAKLKTVRPKLIALLKELEGYSERQRRAGKVAYDFGWMWQELGLSRE